MDTTNDFVVRKPNNSLLACVVDSYFYIETTVAELSQRPEFIIPFPRITFGYFFDHPFTVTNQTLNKSVLVNLFISKISTQKITIQPNSDKVKILGAHLRPFGLSYFTKRPIDKLDWLISPEELFEDVTTNFLRRISTCQNTDQLFDEVEKVFLDNILNRDLSLITAAIMSDMEPGMTKLNLLRTHMFVGILVFVLTLVRVWFFFRHKRPSKLETGTPLHNKLVVWIENSFYYVLILLSISGIATIAMGNLGDAIQSGDASLLPRSLDVPPLGVHKELAILLIVLLIGHIGGVINHYVMKKENTLNRILP